VIQFRFPEGGFDMKVLELHPAERVSWEVVEGPEEWIGTTVSFDLKQEGDNAIVLFRYQDWREPVEFMAPAVARRRRGCPSARGTQGRGRVP
jgi:hypothetical protein